MAKFVLDDLLPRKPDFSESVRKQYEAAIRPFQQHTLDAMMSPAIRDAMRMNEEFVKRFSMPELFAGMRVMESANAAFMEQRRLAKQVAEMMAPVGKMSDLVAAEIARLAPVTDTSRSFERLLKPATDALRDWQQLPSFSAFRDVQQMVAAAYPSALNASLLATMAEFERIGPAAIAFGKTGVNVGGELVAIADINAQFAEALAVEGPGEERLRVFIENVLALARRAPKPIAAALLGIVMWVLLSAGSGEIQFYTGVAMAPVRRVVVRKISALVGESVAPEEQRILRIVSTTTLEVRRYPRRPDSDVVGNLRLGMVVMVVRRQNDWTLVQYVNGDVLVRGWVYSRYLQRIDLPE
jgi:Bacterial SH3 domain